ncbi:hypothetical protein LJE86_18040 [bacterium BMS3Abin03]|nr:hypothetical protein [bacterium BMS3Abin03]
MMINKNTTLILLFIFINNSLLFALTPQDSSKTDSEIYNKKFQVAFGLFLPSINSSVQINRKAGGIGTVVNLETAFHLPETQQLFRGNVIYRFNNNHSVEGYYYALNRSGQNISKDSIVFGELVIDINSSFTSFFKATLFGGKYRYSVHNDKNIEAGFSAGISFLYLDVGAEVLLLNQSVGKEEYNDLLFLPVFGFYNRVHIYDDLIFQSNVDAFALNIKRYNGVLADLSFSLEYRFLQQFSLGTSYNAYSLDVKFDTKEKGEIKYNHKGLMFFGKVYF